MSDNEQRCTIKFCFRHNATETFAKLQQAYGDSVLSRAQASKNIPVAPLPPYSPDLSPCDFFLFRKLKNHLKGHHFGTQENIQTAVTDQLKSIPISEFHQCYEEWKKRLQRCVASEGSYFEGDNVEL
ncbi:putative transposase [Trichonephila clavipes]|nr:putative transposase [Trichonephila clavipes]